MPLAVSRWFTERLDGAVRLMMAGVMVLASLAAHAAGWSLPVWSGEVHGQLLPCGENGPQLKWVFSPGSLAGATRTLSFQIGNAATRLHVVATLDASTGDGSWRIEEGRLDVGPWLTALAPISDNAMVGLSGEGTLTIAGHGAVQNGHPSGAVKISWQGGAIRNSQQGWSLEGVSVETEADVSSLTDGPIAFSMVIRTITTARFGARNFSLNAVADGTRAVAVKAARVEIAGGEVEADPFSVSLASPALNLRLHMTRVGLQDVVALVPTMLSDARGRINGELGVSWSEANGFRLGIGTLDLDEIEPSTLQLAPKPGFLTGRVPARFIFFPKWPAWISNWFAPANPAYPTLADIELGKVSLAVKSLKVRLTPEGDEKGRSASVTVVAHPEQKKSQVKEVVFTINVNGPLSQVLRFGMGQGGRISFGVH